MELDPQIERGDEHAVDTAARDRSKDTLEVALISRITLDGPDRQCRDGLLDLLPKLRHAGIVGVAQHEQPTEARDELFEQLHFLRGGVPEGDEACHVPAGVREAPDDSGGHRVAHVEEDDWDLAGRGLRSPQRLVLERHDQVRPLSGELESHRPRGGFVGNVAEIQVEVLPFLIAQRFQAVSEAVE